MVIKDNFVVPAPVDDVWAFILDMSRVSACMPGAEDVEEVLPDKYKGRLRAQVGVVRAAFDGEVTVTEKVANERLVAKINAEDRALASYVSGTFVSQLAAVEAGTQIDYEIDVAVRGRLATVGFAAMRQVARRMTLEFANRLQEALSDTA